MFFTNPEQWSLLIIIPIYILVALIAYYYHQKKLQKIFGSQQLKKLVLDRSQIKFWFKKGLIVIAFLSLIIALVNPKWGESEEKRKRINTDLVILVDVSSSMLVEDIQPNRLEKVKLKINEIIKMQRGTRIGITVFAGSAFVYTPLTTDYNSLLSFVKNISTTMVSKQGTDLTLGLKTSLEAFMENKSQKILMVFTDGENHNQDYQKVVEEYTKRDITVFMIGVGSPHGEKIPLRDERGVIVDYLRDNSGKFVISKLDYATLSDITKKTGGMYFPLTAKQDDILAINKFINQNQSQTEYGTTQKILKSRYQIFATLAFIALLLEMLIGNKKNKKQNKKTSNLKPKS